jgi:hypothetical protein
MVVYTPVALLYDILSARASSRALWRYSVSEVVSLHVSLISNTYIRKPVLLYTLSAVKPVTNHHNNSDRELDSSEHISVITLCRPDRMKYTCEAVNANLAGYVPGHD